MVLLNAVLFYLVAIRACTEYYLPTLTDFEAVENLAAFHSILIHCWAIALWYTIWSYIKPFRGFRWEKKINAGFYWGLLVVLNFFGLYVLFNRMVYQMNTEPIASYWQYTINLHLVPVKIYLFHVYILMPFIIYSTVLVDTIRNKKQRLQKLLVWLFLVVGLSWVLPQVLFQTQSEAQIPNFTFYYLAHTIILIWFISDYRLFRDGFDEAKKDLLNSISDWAITTDLNLRITYANDRVRQLLAIDGKQPIVSLLTNYSTGTAQQIERMVQQIVQFSDNEVALDLVIPKVGLFPNYRRQTNYGNDQLVNGNSGVGRCGKYGYYPTQPHRQRLKIYPKLWERAHYERKIATAAFDYGPRRRCWHVAQKITSNIRPTSPKK